ncbi:MAG: tRNA pseudouridine(55) synthase TruB [Lentisphaeria bacterium]|nr:tRNA pseudouridine(55) synthase TruB [Lentisphaeria bacterium]
MRKTDQPPFEGAGILLVDKPLFWTSFDVVNFVRSRFNIRKAGHCGTLDPAATGLLILTLGRFTAFSDRFSGQDKCYEAEMLLGAETDSGDLDGQIIARADASHVTEKEIRDTLAGFVGPLMQTPPMVSAVKVNGRKLCDLARKGREIAREPRPIRIYRLDVTNCTPPLCRFTLECSKGTYVRTLCSDAGKKLGTGAVLTALRRTRSGIFDVKDALSIEEIKGLSQDDLAKHLAGFLSRTAQGKMQ